MKRFASYLLVFALLLVGILPAGPVFASTAGASEIQSSQGLKEREIFSLNGIVITEEDKGDLIILRQYTHGVLSDTASYAAKDGISLAASTKAKERSVRNARALRAGSKKNMGGVNYKATTNEGYVFYGMKCSYVAENESSSYTINGYVGTIVQLVKLLVDAIPVPGNVITQFVANLVKNGVINPVGDKIEQALTEKVSCVHTTYTWSLVDKKDSGHKTTVYGHKYLVMDESSKHYREDFFEGFTPNNWGTQTFGIILHDSLFGYTTYEILSWD